MKTRLISLCLFCLLTAAACSLTEQTATPKKELSELITIVYIKDSSSGLCFGIIRNTTYYGYSVASLTHVPCDKVEHLVVK